MIDVSFHIIESATGDEVRVRKTRHGVTLAIRTELGSWQTIELSSETAKSLAEGLGASATSKAQPQPDPSGSDRPSRSRPAASEDRSGGPRQPGLGAGGGHRPRSAGRNPGAGPGIRDGDGQLAE